MDGKTIETIHLKWYKDTRIHMSVFYAVIACVCSLLLLTMNPLSVGMIVWSCFTVCWLATSIIFAYDRIKYPELKVEH